MPSLGEREAHTDGECAEGGAQCGKVDDLPWERSRNNNCNWYENSLYGLGFLLLIAHSVCIHSYYIIASDR